MAEDYGEAAARAQSQTLDLIAVFNSAIKFPDKLYVPEYPSGKLCNSHEREDIFKFGHKI